MIPLPKISHAYSFLVIDKITAETKGRFINRGWQRLLVGCLLGVHSHHAAQDTDEYRHEYSLTSPRGVCMYLQVWMNLFTDRDMLC
jgi:hypothetical protein